MEAELQGFKKVVREGVRVDVNTTIRVDLKLEVGQLSETVQVAAETPLLQTDRTDTGRIIESKMVAELPLTFNRNFQSLLITVPGVDPAAPRALAVLQLAGLARRRSQRPATSREQHADRRARQQPQDRAAAGDHPAADALETVNVTTSNYDAEFGRPAARRSPTSR